MRRYRFLAPVALALALGLGVTACVVAAAGAGAGGGIYLTQRGVEAVVPASLDRAGAATDQAFAELKIHRTKQQTVQQENGEKREVEGTAGDRDISVTLQPEDKGSTRVQVVAKTGTVSWDKDFARTVLDHIVAHSR
jgi:Protein of unknown function (DUF3568)